MELAEATPLRGMDLSLYIEAELERQELRREVRMLEKDLENLKDYLVDMTAQTEK